MKFDHLDKTKDLARILRWEVSGQTAQPPVSVQALKDRRVDGDRVDGDEKSPSRSRMRAELGTAFAKLGSIGQR
jgi:hypothetical protein